MNGAGNADQHVQESGSQESSTGFRAFTQLKSELIARIEQEIRVAVDLPGAPRSSFRKCLEFMARTLVGIQPEMAVTLRPKGAEKHLTFVCSPWTASDRKWLDTFATFDHRTSDDQKIIWIPGRSEQGRLQEMYRSLQTMACSPALRSVLRKHGPAIHEDNTGRYIWFWNGE